MDTPTADEACRAGRARDFDRFVRAALRRPGSARPLEALLARLSHEDRLAYLLFAVDRCSMEQIADRTASTRAMSKLRVYAARRELMTLIRRDPAFR